MGPCNSVRSSQLRGRRRLVDRRSQVRWGSSRCSAWAGRVALRCSPSAAGRAQPLVGWLNLLPRPVVVRPPQAQQVQRRLLLLHLRVHRLLLRGQALFRLVSSSSGLCSINRGRWRLRSASCTAQHSLQGRMEPPLPCPCPCSCNPPLHHRPPLPPLPLRGVPLSLRHSLLLALLAPPLLLPLLLLTLLQLQPLHQRVVQRLLSRPWRSSVRSFRPSRRPWRRSSRQRFLLPRRLRPRLQQPMAVDRNRLRLQS